MNESGDGIQRIKPTGLLDMLRAAALAKEGRSEGDVEPVVFGTNDEEARLRLSRCGWVGGCYGSLCVSSVCLYMRGGWGELLFACCLWVSECVDAGAGGERFGGGWGRVGPPPPLFVQGAPPWLFNLLLPWVPTRPLNP